MSLKEIKNMGCGCGSKISVYAKQDNYIDSPHCVDCAHFQTGQNYCTRFLSMISGKQALVPAIEARSEDRLCGALGVYWEQRKEVS